MLLEFHLKTGHTRIRLNLRRDSTTVSMDEKAVYSFDLEGRLLTAWLDDQTFIRTLANRVVRKWRDKSRPGFWKRIENLGEEETRDFLEQTSQLMRSVYSTLLRGETVVQWKQGQRHPPTPPSKGDYLRQGGRFQAARNVPLEISVQSGPGFSPPPSSKGGSSGITGRRTLSEGVDKASGDGQTQALDVAKQRMATIAPWDYPRLENEWTRFHSVYKPVSILPPDQYLSVVLQATEGCHWNRCTFCDFYRHTSFHIKSPEEFSHHMRAVKHFFGEAIWLRPRVFLGDANALVIPQETLVSIFDQLNSEFPMQSSPIACPSETPTFRGVYSFIDVFTGIRKSASDFQELNARNLRRVYLGVETGCDDLLQFLNKPASSQETYDIVGAIKQAGVSVGVILLVGVGGDRYSKAHIDQTLDLVNHLDLCQGDILYFSPLWESSKTEYDALAAARGIRRLTDVELRQQLETMREGLTFNTGSEPTMALYDIREFVY